MDAQILSRGIVISNNIEDYPGGIIIPVDKPYRWTSADVIRKIKYGAIRHFNKKNLKVGHAGTLDPLATGVLLVCIGNATKAAESLQASNKEYIAGIAFGATTPSYDLEKEIDRHFEYSHITEEKLRSAMATFIGRQEQIAPLFSAKSVDGIRAYEVARKLYKSASGDFDEKAKELIRTSIVEITEMELLGFYPDGREKRQDVIPEASQKSLRINVTDNSELKLPAADIRIVCSKGTYIRALARDLGEALGSGAHLDSLIRSRNGSFKVEDALRIEEITEI